MKQLLLAAAFVFSPVAAHAVDWKKPPYDKYAHIAIAAPISAWVTSETGSPAAGIAATTLIGTLKEASDLHFDKKDLYSWIVGGAIGAAITQELTISKTGVFFRVKKDF
jgi:hypothetical protein